MRIEIAGPCLLSKASRYESRVVAPVDQRDKGPLASAHHEQSRVDRRRWIELGRQDPTRQRELVPGAPRCTQPARGPRKGAFPCHIPFNDEVGTAEAHARVVEQTAQHGRRDVEGQVSHHAEPFGWKSDLENITTQHLNVRPATGKPARELWIELDRHNVSSGASELRRQRAAARSDLDDKLVRRDRRVAHDLGRQATRADEVLALGFRSATGLPRASRASACHGRSPCPSPQLPRPESYRLPTDSTCPPSTCRAVGSSPVSTSRRAASSRRRPWLLCSPSRPVSGARRSSCRIVGVVGSNGSCRASAHACRNQRSATTISHS